MPKTCPVLSCLHYKPASAISGTQKLGKIGKFSGIHNPAICRVEELGKYLHIILF